MDDDTTDTQTDPGSQDTSTSQDGSGQQLPDSDVDGAAAKRHGDYFVEVGDYNTAVGYYLEAINKGDLSGVDLDKVYYNLASCYYHLGDQNNCYQYAYQASKSSDATVEQYALRFFFWSVTGEAPAGLN